MDERERRGVQTRRARQQEVQRRRPSSSARRTGGRPEADRAAGNPNMQRTRRRSSRARRRRRNLIIRTFLFIIVLIALIVGVIFWKKYGSSNEKADLNQYYGLVNGDDMAVIVNNQVIRSTDDAEAVSPGKMFDGIPLCRIFRSQGQYQKKDLLGFE